MLRKLGSLTPRQRTSETPEERDARLEKRRSRGRKSDPVLAFGGALSDIGSPRPKEKWGNRDELLLDSPKAATSAPGTPPSSVKKPRLFSSEDHPYISSVATPTSGAKPSAGACMNSHKIASTPTSSAKRQPMDSGAGVGLYLSPPPSSSKKPRLSPLNQTPRADMSPPRSSKRSLHADMQSPRACIPGAESPLRSAAVADSCRAPVAPPASCQLPRDCPRLSVNAGVLGASSPLKALRGVQGAGDDDEPPEATKAKKTSRTEDSMASPPPQSARSLASLRREVQQVTSEDPALRASAPASIGNLFAEAKAPAPSPQAPSEPRRPHSARPSVRPLPAIGRAGSALLSGAARVAHQAGRLMSPRRMMSPGRVNSPRCEPPSPRPAPATTSEKAPTVGAPQQPAGPVIGQRPGGASASSAWLPSPRRPEQAASKMTPRETTKKSQSAASTPRVSIAEALVQQHGFQASSEAEDPAEALVQPMLSAVYGRPLSSAEVAAATSACPEITWLAQCALLCPLQVGWRQCPAEKDAAGSTPALYACELTGEVSEQPPHLARFSKLARLLLHAVTHPSESHTAAAWLKVEIEDAHSECLRLQESWCRSLDPSNGAEFWHNPMTGKSSWQSPAGASAYTAAVAERILDTEPFKAWKLAEAAQVRKIATRPQPPKASAQVQSARAQSASRSHRPESANHAQAGMGRSSKAPEIFDLFEDAPTPAQRRSNKRAKESPRDRNKHVDFSEESPELVRHSARRSSKDRSARRSKRPATREISGTATPPAIIEFAMATEESSDAPEPECFDMATPANTPPKKHRRPAPPCQQAARPQPPVQEALAQQSARTHATDTDAAVALAGAAAALATAAAALSARGPRPESNGQELMNQFQNLQPKQLFFQDPVEAAPARCAPAAAPSTAGALAPPELVPATIAAVIPETLAIAQMSNIAAVLPEMPATAQMAKACAVLAEPAPPALPLPTAAVAPPAPPAPAPSATPAAPPAAAPPLQLEVPAPPAAPATAAPAALEGLIAAAAKEAMSKPEAVASTGINQKEERQAPITPPRLAAALGLRKLNAEPAAAAPAAPQRLASPQRLAAAPAAPQRPATTTPSKKETKSKLKLAALPLGASPVSKNMPRAPPPPAGSPISALKVEEESENHVVAAVCGG